MTGSTHAPETRRIVVAGGGPAAHRFADAMHTRGLEGWHLTVLAEEVHLPYDRVALSKALSDMEYDLTMGDTAMWDHESITLRTGERVISVDTGAQTVTTSTGASYPYDHLVVATGSDAAKLPFPGGELAHVYRTLDDVWNINKTVAELGATLGRKVRTVTIGGGLLGLEAAAGTMELGAEAAIVNGSRWLMNAQLDEGAGQALGRLVAARSPACC